jgi:Uma2 family endonuclease
MEKPVSSSTETRTTPEEYLRLERLSETRNEFFGEIIPMPGVSREHNRINRNLVVDLTSQLEQSQSEVFFCEMRVKISATRSYSYPDVVVVSGQPQFEDSHVDTLLNPCVIIEILSESTEMHDRGEKLRQYRSIESLQDYVLVSQTELRIERYSRQSSGEWTYSDLTGAASVLDLQSIQCRVPLGRVYRNVEFSAGPPQS